MKTYLCGLVATFVLVTGLTLSAAAADNLVPVTIENFNRAETDLYFGRFVKEKGLGKLGGTGEVTPIDKQDVVRMNRDTIYSSGVFDLDAGPLTITLPNTGKRFMSMQIINEDHYTIEATHVPGPHTYSKDKVGTRYVFALVRMLANPQDTVDVKAANDLLAAIKVEQSSVGSWEVPNWDQDSQTKIREALEQLNSVKGETSGEMFGSKSEVDPVLFLIGTAVGWGGNPRSAAIYVSVYPKENDGKKPYALTVKDVPVDGFWSISLYNAKGFFEKNDFGAYSLNNLTVKPNSDGSFTIRFGGCDGKIANCLPIVKGWNYTVRLYRPRAEILNGTWKFPEAKPQ
jgi:para-nitrobenzyl esterase